jgi:hypothetical protein
VDEALRELERRCETAGDAGLWAALARARLRSGLRPAVALAAVRAGIRLAPADGELARVRDEALAAFWREPAYVPLLERHGASGRRVVFSHDGQFLAVASPGVIVVRIEPHELVGAGFPRDPCEAVAFVGPDLLVGQPRGLISFSPASGREGARLDHAGGVQALGTSADGTRGVLHDRQGTTLRFTLGPGKMTPRDRDQIFLPSAASCVLMGLSPEEDTVVRRSGMGRAEALSGTRFEKTPILWPAQLAFEQLLAGEVVLSPDRGAITRFLDGGVEISRLGGTDGATTKLGAVRSTCSAAAFSPCGSRLALIRAQPPALLVLEAC